MGPLMSESRVVLAEGAIIERLRRDESIELDPHILNAGLLYDARGRAALGVIYQQYLAIGRDYGLPTIICTPTWRASEDRLCAAGFPDSQIVNHDAARFLRALRTKFGVYGGSVVIGGLLGCRGDSYDPNDALSSRDALAYHRPQATALREAEVDFLLAATLPAASEAIGMARALAQTGCPYVLSVVVRPTGTMLDGTPLGDFVARVDREVSPRPFGYAVNCVHPTVFAAAMTSENVVDAVAERVIGLQANASIRSPEELDEAPVLETAEPGGFANLLAAAARAFGLRYVGGCCGTDDRHIRAVAKRLCSAGDSAPPADQGRGQ